MNVPSERVPRTLAADLASIQLAVSVIAMFGRNVTGPSSIAATAASGRLVEGIMAAIAEFYSDNLGQEVRKGMQQKLRNGGWPHMAPVGYLNLRVSGERKSEAILALDP